MQKQRNAKNPAVWRKTGQPETDKSSLGKHLMKTSSDAGGINSINENRKNTEKYNDYSSAENQFSLNRRVSIAKSRNDSYYVAGKMPPKDNVSVRNDFQPSRGVKEEVGADPFGLGFQSKRNPVATSEDVDSFTPDYQAQEGKLPSINENNSRGNDKRGWSLKDDEIKDAPSQDDPQKSKMAASFTWNQGFKKSSKPGERWNSVKLPPVVSSSEHENNQTLEGFSRKDNLQANSNTLLPFTIIEGRNSENTSKRGDISYNSPEQNGGLSDMSETKRNRFKISTNGRFANENTPMTNSRNDMGLKRLSIYSGYSPQEIISHQNLMNEAYSMQAFRFTNNYTFSFFDIPSSYEDQNKQLQSSVNLIGKRRAPKCSKPFKKPVRNQVKPAKIDS